MGVLGESSVVLIPAVNKPFGSVTSGAMTVDMDMSELVSAETVAKRFSSLRRFAVSPPERIGICGEYDYNGLAKRVAQHFQQSVREDISQLKVSQRGCVVILTGTVSSRELLNRLVMLAISVEGAALVEIFRVRFTEEERISAEDLVA